MYFKSAWEGNNSWHLYLIGFLLSMEATLLGKFRLLYCFYKVCSNTYLGPDFDITAFQESMNFQKFGISTNVGFFTYDHYFCFCYAGSIAGVENSW
ncbi:MAG: hypothetical protein IPK25_14465 [Saprospiraceae bacterium]|nr:hypothetical protein [Saprospiraceae bacterium]